MHNITRAGSGAPSEWIESRNAPVCDRASCPPEIVIPCAWLLAFPVIREGSIGPAPLAGIVPPGRTTHSAGDRPDRTLTDRRAYGGDRDHR